MNGVHGIIFSYEKSNGLRELTEPRIHGSVPFGGSYRMVDFILSDMVNAGIRDVGVIMHGKCQSMMDHLRSGKSWDLSRSFGGLTLLPVFAYNSARGNGRFRGKLEALDVVKDYLRHIRQDYVLLADSDVALNIDLKAMLESHIKAGADITVVCAPSTGDGLYLNLDETGRVMEAVEEQHQGLRCLQIFLLRTELLLSLVERFVSRHEYSFQGCVLQGLTKELHIQGYAFHGFAAHITDVAGYYASSMRLLDPAVRQDLFCPDRPIYAKENDAASTYMDPQGGCVNSLVDDGCDIQGRVRGSILSRDVRVEKGAVVEGCILFKDTVVEKGAVVRHVIADKAVRIGPGVHLEGAEKYPLVLGKGAEV